jgi:hypothetical protein
VRVRIVEGEDEIPSRFQLTGSHGADQSTFWSLPNTTIEAAEVLSFRPVRGVARLLWLPESEHLEDCMPLRIAEGARLEAQSWLRLGCAFCRTLPGFADLSGLSSFAATSLGELLINGLEVRVLPGSPLQLLQSVNVNRRV